MRSLPAYLLLCGLSLLSLSRFTRALAQAPAAPSAPDAFIPSPSLSLRELKALLRARSPALQEPALQLALRRAEVRQSRLMDNPVADFAVGALPVGPTNPPDLPDPLRNIPNYQVGLSLRPDLFRRGPRQDRAAAAARGAMAQLDAAVRDQALRLLRTLGAMAVASLQLSADQGLAAKAHEALGLARDRVRTGYSPPIDADRAEIEALRLDQLVLADQGRIQAAQADCAALLGVPCAPFAEAVAARLFLETWAARVPGPENDWPLAERPDLVALRALRASAEAEGRLARAQLAPDPTVRLGYVYDSFFASGAQQHSLNLSLSLPLPFIDRGQAAAEAAAAQVRHLGAQHQLLLSASAARIAGLRQALTLQQLRRDTLQRQVIPRARAILNDVSRAFAARAVALTDVIQARRALDDLLLQEADALGEVFQTVVALIEQTPDLDRDAP
jgi:cobalt-zinc-cadmium efflux system outer membrane protein